MQRNAHTADDQQHSTQPRGVSIAGPGRQIVGVERLSESLVTVANEEAAQ